MEIWLIKISKQGPLAWQYMLIKIFLPPAFIQSFFLINSVYFMSYDEANMMEMKGQQLQNPELSDMNLTVLLKIQ